MDNSDDAVQAWVFDCTHVELALAGGVVSGFGEPGAILLGCGETTPDVIVMHYQAWRLAPGAWRLATTTSLADH